MKKGIQKIPNIRKMTRETDHYKKGLATVQRLQSLCKGLLLQKVKKYIKHTKAAKLPVQDLFKNCVRSQTF